MDILLMVIINNPHMAELLPPNIKRYNYGWWKETINFAESKKLRYLPANPLAAKQSILIFENIEEMDKFISLYYTTSDPSIANDIKLWNEANEITVESCVYVKTDPATLGIDTSNYPDLHFKKI